MARWSPFFLLLVLGLAKATSIDIDGFEEEDGEERTVFTSGGTYYIALNTTYLLYYSLLAGMFICHGLNISIEENVISHRHTSFGWSRSE